MILRLATPGPVEVQAAEERLRHHWLPINSIQRIVGKSAQEPTWRNVAAWLPTQEEVGLRLSSGSTRAPSLSAQIRILLASAVNLPDWQRSTRFLPYTTAVSVQLQAV